MVGPAAAGGATQQVEIVDPAGFGRPMRAATAQIPAGWRTQGGVSWNRASHCITNQLQVAWIAASPDGSQAFEVLPGFNWQLDGTQIQMNPCPAAPYGSTRAFLEGIVQLSRVGARVLDYRDRPDLAQQAAASAPANPQAQQRQDSGQLLIAYRHDGRDVREVLSATVAFSSVQGNVVGGTSMVFAQRAPEGQLEFALGDRIAASIRADPQWLAAMREAGANAEHRFSTNQRQQISDWHARQMAAINARGAAERAAILAQTNRDVAAIYSATNANTQATNDRIHDRTIDTINEVNPYHDPVSGRRVESSIHGGSRVLRAGDDSYINTDDPYLNPPGSQELERIE